MAGKLGTAEKWRDKKSGRKMVGTKWWEKWYFRHGPSRNWPVGPAVTRKAGVHAVQRPFGFGRAET